VLFDKDNPQNPINRRISIIVMTKAAEDSALKTETRPETPPPAPQPLPSGVAASAGPPAPAQRVALPVVVPAALHSPPIDTASPGNVQPLAPPPIRGTEAPVAPAEGAPG
jgi:chemotaxis protein MotB